MYHPNLIAHYRFESTQANLGIDASGNGHHGTVYGATQGIGQFGGGADFTTNDYIEDLNFVPTVEGTWSIFVKFSSWGLSWNINKAAFCLPAGVGSIASVADNTVRLRLYDTTFRDQNITLPNLNEYYHIVVAFSTTSRTYYLNGVEIATTSFAGYNLAYGNGLWMGSNYNQNPDRFMDGGLDEVKIFDKCYNNLIDVNLLRIGQNPR